MTRPAGGASRFAVLAAIAISCGGRANSDARSDAATASPPETSVDASDGTADIRDAQVTVDADEDSATPPSCAPGGPGMTNCGPGGSGAESCCTSLEVTGGTYYRTYTSDADGGAVGLADPATVSSFRLDKYDVTVGRFRQFVNVWNGGWRPPAGSGKHSHLNAGMGLAAEPNVDAGQAYEPGWLATDDGTVASDPNVADPACLPGSTWTNTAGTQENLPINCVDWYESYAFCIWDGGFLPSEAEWEYAAAGGNQQREYPWGSADPGTLSHYAIYACYYPNGPGSEGGSEIPGGGACGFGAAISNIAQVGFATLGAGLWGQLDLAGNVYQWDIDWFENYVDPCVDCARLREAAKSGPVMRGGAFDWPTYYFSPYRNTDPPETHRPDTGVRCARTP